MPRNSTARAAVTCSHILCTLFHHVTLLVRRLLAASVRPRSVHVTACAITSLLPPPPLLSFPISSKKTRNARLF
jgi:hypothetical protein